ncbi:MAG: bifunctional (p)ppGpp synthetase/guanosine-3',5'-bis(diphosphate) 3'-pyrophosphohydrolase [Lachnospiraceae bacterium]|nr:bifunctional (p)ppGpp synthetase/guanosine-3',5'-bis(diphosphate) 3'-pyrophosphohydrolase [Lachnospiraceae bacterium]MBO4558850.1 bifunctional (p)ppGpp synthetase/guanosine-3',5'-bis(diphosphate) 3'-pyrophosphohydrolase [Lachnospiraceae bacterium]MBR5733476.1 bifunctional (p)ppGpp synthetase/guanosine-3',5'-bis(diphosphate) 3'-pyrophosphohydrolase [Lachnospiraceae bacterium]
MSDKDRAVGTAIPADFTDPAELHDILINRIKQYHAVSGIDIIEKAYKVAYEAHKDQKRKSGEPYIIHPICVAIILADLELDIESIAAGLLHDVVEDTSCTYEQLVEMFGEEIALLVDGVTKLTKLNYSADKVELQAENLRKMFLAMAKDIRVILIKLADRLHNMRTMQYQPPNKQYEKSKETMDIYCPIAQRLGISKIKIELDDLSLQYLEPVMYKELSEKVKAKLAEKEDFITEIVAEVANHIEDASIEAKVNGRVKHLFSIYKKMVTQNKTLDQIYDLFAVRIIVKDIKDCYAALGVIHEMYKPIPGRFKDYIAMPKPNMYQSLHTTLISSTGQPFEVQIRTQEMHRIAEFGIAAHWKYKSDPEGKSTADSEEEKLSWLRQILEWQQELSDNKEFLMLLKDDLNLFSDSVFCFTPSGEVKNLTVGSTPIDFAYSIHSAVGNKMVGARVNNKLVPIEYTIQNGDQVEIITSQNSKGPSRDWLKIVKTTQAKNKINQWFKSEFKEENIVRGKDLVLNYCKTKGIDPADILKPEFEAAVLRKYGYREWDSVYASIGHGGLKEGQIVARLQEEYEKTKRKEMTDANVLESFADVNFDRKPILAAKGSIIVQGVNDVAVHFSKCCSPVPGDEICGFVTRGRGVSIHRTDCINIMTLSEEERARLIPAEWNEAKNQAGDEVFSTEINLYVKNRSGVLLDISKITTENHIDVTSMNARTSKQGIATVTIGFSVKDRETLATITSKLRNIEGVIDIQRSMG